MSSHYSYEVSKSKQDSNNNDTSLNGCGSSSSSPSPNSNDSLSSISSDQIGSASLISSSIASNQNMNDDEIIADQQDRSREPLDCNGNAFISANDSQRMQIDADDNEDHNNNSHKIGNRHKSLDDHESHKSHLFQLLYHQEQTSSYDLRKKNSSHSTSFSSSSSSPSIANDANEKKFQCLSSPSNPSDLNVIMNSDYSNQNETLNHHKIPNSNVRSGQNRTHITDSTNHHTSILNHKCRRLCNDCKATKSDDAAHYLLYELPDEVLLTIFSYFYEQDLCSVSQVCKRFNKISNDCGLWRNLYHNLYEYDNPLFYRGIGKFEFVPAAESDLDNPWKESFKQLV